MICVDQILNAPSQFRNRGFRATVTSLFLVLLAVSIPAKAQNKISTIAGGGTVNPSPLLADIPGPTATVEDAKGNLFIAPPNSQDIYKWTKKTGQVTVYVGTGYLSDHHKPGQRLTEPLWVPAGLAIDTKGNLYIADTDNNAIKEVNPSTGWLRTIIGTSKPCEGGPCGDDGKAINALLLNPQGVAVDQQGNVYVADTGDNRVRCMIMVQGGCGSSEPIGNLVNYAGTVDTTCSSSTSPCGDGGPANQALLNGPMGIAVDGAGYVYIADTFDNRIRQVGAGQVINTIAGTGNNSVGNCSYTGNPTTVNLGGPRAVSVDSTGNVYIADTKNNCISWISAGAIGRFAGTGQRGFTGDGGQPASAQLAAPNGVFVDAKGNVLISDTGNQRVREVVGGVSGTINTIQGGGFGGDGAAATGTYTTLANDVGVAVDSANNYYIADTSNNRIRVVNTQTSPITIATVVIQPGDIATIAGTGVANYTGDNGPATSATLNSPFGVGVDSVGNIYIADSTNRVIRMVNAATGIITTIAGTGGSCPPKSPCGDGGPATQARLTTPTSVALDPAGNLFIADTAAQRVREVSGGIISTLAGDGINGFSGDGGPATQALLWGPFGVAVDSNDDVYIADSVNNRIRCILGAVGGCGDTAHQYQVGWIITYAYNGMVTFGGDGGPATQASRWLPQEVALDSRGNLFIGGGNDSLVQRVDLTTGIIVTVAGNDQLSYYYGFTGDGGPANKAHIDGMGVAVDSHENLLIADNGNNRVREVPMIGKVQLTPNSLSFGDQKVGSSSQPQTVTLTNVGADDIAFSSITISGDFSQTNSCIGNNIPPLAPSLNCTITVTFTPTRKGTRNGTVTINDNAWGKKHTIPLTGTGT
jgi:hypothetical protein